MVEYDKFNKVNIDKSQLFPPDYYQWMQEVMDPGEEPLLCTASDLNLDGLYQEQWIIVTDIRIYTLHKDDRGIRADTYALKEIEEVNINNFYGVGTLVVITAQGAHEIARFTRRYRKRFYRFSEILRSILNEEEPEGGSLNHGVEDQTDSIHGEGRCPNCGTPFFRGSSTCPKCSSKTETLKRLLSYLAPYKLRATMMLLTTLLFAGLNLIPPYLQKIMIDEVIGPRKLSYLKWIVLAILGVHLTRAVFHGLRTYQLSWLGQKITYDLRSKVYAHLQTLGLSYYDRRMTGAIMNRVTGDTASIQGFIVGGIQEVIVQSFTLLIITIVLFSMDWQLALVVLLPTPFIFFGTKRFRKHIHKIYHRIWRRRSNMSAVLGGTIPGIKVVKAFTQEEYETGKFREALEDYFNEEIRAVKYRSVFFPLIDMATSLGAVLIWGYGGYRVIAAQTITLGTLTAFIGYMWRFYQPVQMLSHLSEQFEGAVTAAERVFEVLDHEPEFKEYDDIMPLRDLQIEGEIEFKDVSFNYQAEDEVLKNINLHIKPGEMIGLVGASGSGKTTLVNLIPRFYEAREGQILIDGHNINDIDLTALRSQIGVVLQEPYLFFGTVAENIAYGKPDATLEEIVWAAKAANAHKFIMNFPDGYDSIVGERGVGLSGGEKQRISIARAILKNPKILILDEATSSVDTETEKLIQEAIDRLIKNRTTIAIAHRLSTLKNADRIIVLENGFIVEEGTHDELMAKEGGAFRHLVEIQAEIAKTKVV